MKVCKDCGVEKPLTEFYKNAHKYSSCKKCKNELSKEWAKNNPDKVKQQRRKTRLKTNYGLTPEQYDKMLHEQNGVCYICKGVDDNKALAVDHCHSTGKIRKLLCTNCNTVLGKVKEDVTLLSKLLSYLKEN